MKKFNRRNFLKSSLLTSAGIGLTTKSAFFEKIASWKNQPTTDPIPKKELGNTGHQVSIYSLGGEATVLNPDRRDDAIEIIHHALDLGINYIDTAALYGRGVSETNIGAVLKDRRDEVFLATKSHDYTYDGTMRLFEDGLRRLQTDYIDLYQHHYVGYFGQLEQLQTKNSARQAFERLKDEGVIGHIGITGHSSRLLTEAINDYPYDCVLITLNAALGKMDDTEHLERFFALTAEKNIGVIAMKVANKGDLLKKGLSIHQLLPYTMSYPVSTTVVGITEKEHLDENVSIARNFKELSDEEITEIREIARKS